MDNVGIIFDDVAAAIAIFAALQGGRSAPE